MKRIFLSAIVVATLWSCQKDKTAYVNNSELIQSYNKMKRTDEMFQAKNEELSKELDSVAMSFQKEVQEFQAEMNQMSQSKREAEQNKLIQKQQQLQQQQQQRSQVLRQESDAAINEIIDEVKAYVSDYGEENNYTYIFGSNESANIMYAKKGLDLTEEILAKLNAKDSLAQEK